MKRSLIEECVKLMCEEDCGRSDFPTMLYRVGSLDGMRDSPKGLFFTANPSYLEGNMELGPRYSATNARAYSLKPGSRVFDPEAEFELYEPYGWDNIRVLTSDLDRFGIEDETDFDMDPKYGTTSTEGLAIAGRKLGYDATVIRGVPRRQESAEYDEYAVYNPDSVISCDAP